MFFHIDESGNTGNNLFDRNQPRLSYGVISSDLNVDALGIPLHSKILKIIGDEQIHANELGIGGLVEIAPLLIQIQEKIKFSFDYYFVQKTDFALVLFFDSVFDAGINDAVKWDWYWTPLRYLLIANLARVFDEETLKESWRLCTTRNVEKYSYDIVCLLKEIKSRVENSNIDLRGKEIIVDALDFGIVNPLDLDFGHPDQKMISPNAVGFQFVTSTIARRVWKKKRKSASSIIVDRQTQFNRSQQDTHEQQGVLAEGLIRATKKERERYINQPLYATFNYEDIIHRGLPNSRLTISQSKDSIGLQIVDVYLWLSNKIFAKAELPIELKYLWSLYAKKGMVDGISIEGMMTRFANFDQLLPKFEELTEDQKSMNKKLVDDHRAKVINLKLSEQSNNL